MHRSRFLLSCFTVAALLAAAPTAHAACEPNEAPCVTRHESGWSRSLNVSDRGVRVQVQTWGWVWSSEYGEWQWQALVQETVSRDHQEQEEYSSYETTSSWTGWRGWNW
jgi:hypothetical protein